MPKQNAWTFTALDKAILAAVLAPIWVALAAYLNGGDFDAKNLIAAVAAGLLSGVGVYLKANAPAT